MYNWQRRRTSLYKIRDLVADKQTQFGPNVKLKAKYFGPYKIIRVKGRDIYDVTREGYYNRLQCTTIFTKYIKPWTQISQ